VHAVLGASPAEWGQVTNQDNSLFGWVDVHWQPPDLVSAFTTVRKQEGELKLLNLTNKVRDVMQITRLYTVFDIMDDEAAAVKSFGQSAATG
jgi:hypothetical protein